MSEVTARQPSGEDVLQRAQALVADAQFGAAVDCARRALEVEPSNPNYISAMAHALMPGPGYKHLLRRLHKHLQPASYVEVGVSKGKSLALAGAATHCVGIDPAFRIEADIEAEARLFPITSDAFFQRYDLLEELRCERLDLAFIDGLHIFEQALRDFANIERFANPDTLVLVHDCYPVSALTAQRERETNFWSGDVWKLVPCLLRERPDLEVHVVPCRPTGLALISGLNPGAQAFRDNLPDVIARYRDLPYGDIPEQREGYFPLVENNWDAIRSVLPGAA